MSEPKLISPLLDDFVMGAPMSEHHGVRCCPAMPNNSDKRYIVKIISIPASQVQLDALLLAGAYSSQASALSYFKELADDTAAEAEILKKLSKFEGFVPYEGVQIAPMEGKTGYEVYLLSPYKRSLERHMRKKPMTHLNAVNLGLDLCASMVMCRRAGYLYVDLKPGNVFINEKQEFRVGDLGFVKLDSLKYASLPDKYRSAYTAPEVTDAWSSLNDTIDTYAIGMILYQVYNDGKLPENAQPLPAPMYADYEMAEIILKAVAPDPKDRWADPMQMGQALVAYMQRNTVNDVPIVPLPVVTTEPVPEEPAPEEPVPTDIPENTDTEPEAPAPVSEEPVDTVTEDEPDEPMDEISDLSFMDDMVSDETAPDVEVMDEIEYHELSEEISDILSLADDLLAHETPEPVVAPEPIDVPIPEPITLEDDAHEEPAEPAPAAATTGSEEEEASEEIVEAPTEDASEDVSPEKEEPLPAASPDPEEPEDSEDEPEDAPAPKKKRRWGGVILTVLLLLLLAAGMYVGYTYYNDYYLQTVYNLELYGEDNHLEVRLTTDIDESLLSVVCTDTYGTTRTQAVVNGKAVFEDLNPDTIYKVKVVITGNHELQGEISGDYTTPAQTNIVRFDAIAGSDDGSVILNFTIDGKDSNTWTVTYTAEGENEKTVTFSGHLVTINGLTLDKLYTFTLSTESSLYIVGNDTVTFTSTALVYAQNVDIIACNDSGLTAVWTAPEGIDIESWTVRCYSDGGYDQTIETTDTTATFTDLDPSQAFTVEVVAKGMTVGTRDYVTANSATVTGITVDTSTPLELTVTWDFTGVAPESGWLVMYNMEGSEIQEVLQTTENSVTIYPTLPKQTYEFTVQAADGTTVFDGSFSAEAGTVKLFSGYTVSTENMTWWMVRRPSNSGWTHSDVPAEDYTNTFAPGENAAFIIKLDKKYSTSPDIITTLFVVRDANKQVVCTSTSSSSWTYMWYQYYCELDIPTMPTAPGTYTMDVYFNGMAAVQITFTISE